jgi:type II secretory pathway component PulM
VSELVPNPTLRPAEAQVAKSAPPAALDASPVAKLTADSASSAAVAEVRREDGAGSGTVVWLALVVAAALLAWLWVR